MSEQAKEQYDLRDLNVAMTGRPSWRPHAPPSPRADARQARVAAQQRRAARRVALETERHREAVEEALWRTEARVIWALLLLVALWCWRGCG